jgi:hypothetical protein
MPSEVGKLGDPMRESEVEFWSRQLSEHALFFQLGLDDPSLKAAAGRLHTAWEQARPTVTAQAAAGLARDLRDFKVGLLDRLNRGQWLGWIFPTFVDHTLRELDLFVSRLHGPVLPQTDCRAWLRFMAEHAAFAAHLMDPVEATRIRVALKFVSEFSQLEAGCTGVSDQLLSLSTRSGQLLDNFMVGQVARAKGIIHPVLAVHVVREGRRFLRTVSDLQRKTLH